MTITVEQVRQAAPELRALIGELDDALGALYEPHQRHGLSIEQPARGTGVATAVLRRIEDEVRAAGVRPCGPFGPYGQMSADRIEMSRFYEKIVGE